MLCILAFSSLSDVWYPKGCCISTRYHPLNMPWKDGGVYIVKVWCMWFIIMCGLSCIFPTSPGKVVCFTILQFVLDVRFGYLGSINRFWWLEITSRFRGSYSRSDCAKLNLKGSAFFQQHKWVDGLPWAEVFILVSNIYIYIYISYIYIFFNIYIYIYTCI